MSVLLLSGCGTEKNDSTENTVSNDSDALLTSSGTNEFVKGSNLDLEFAPGETIPVLLDGDVTGYITVNWVQRLGIWDLQNAKAVTAGVKNSYTINMTVDFSQSIKSAQSRVVTILPYLVDSAGNTIGNPCCVGWSGFSTTAQFYDKTTVTNVEIGVQPEQLNIDNAHIVLKLSDSLGNNYDDIALSNSYITSASDGQALVASGSKTLHTINGGAFTISVPEVYVEEHTRGGDTAEQTYCDFVYGVNYDSAPTNSREDLLFDSNKGNALHTKLVAYVTTDTDGTKLYDNVTDAERLKYSDMLETEEYVTTKYIDLNLAGNTSVQCNRVLPTASGSPMYARVCFEFPEEKNARSLEEMKDFDGRFLVFQQKIGKRDLPEFSVEDQDNE